MKFAIHTLLLATLLTTSDALGIPSECLIHGVPVPRAEIGNATSSETQLTQSASTDMRPLNFTTCVDEDDVLAGIQFTLWSEETQTALELPPLGTLAGACRSLTLDGGGIEAMRASFSQEGTRVNAIHYFKGGSKVTFGTLLPNGFTEWNFTAGEPLIGLYGR